MALWPAADLLLSWCPALLLVAPLGLLALGAVSETWDSRGPRGFTLDAFDLAWSFSARSARFSLCMAVASAVLATGLAVPVAYLLAKNTHPVVRILRPMLSLPIVFPNFLFAMSLMMAFPGLQGGWVLLLLVYVIQCLPFAIWPLAAALTLLDINTLDSAGRSLGASPTQRFIWLVLPLLARPAAIGAMTVFVLVLAESSSSFFLASGQHQPFGVSLYNAFQDLDLRVAAAMTMVLIVMLAPAVIILEIWLGAATGTAGGNTDSEPASPAAARRPAMTDGAGPRH